MMRQMKPVCCVAAVLAALCLLAAPVPAAAAEKALTIALTADAVHVDPQQGNELTSNIMFNHFYDTLVRRTADLSFVPGLAESWEMSEDARPFTAPSTREHLNRGSAVPPIFATARHAVSRICFTSCRA